MFALLLTWASAARVKRSGTERNASRLDAGVSRRERSEAVGCTHSWAALPKSCFDHIESARVGVEHDLYPQGQCRQMVAMPKRKPRQHWHT